MAEGAGEKESGRPRLPEIHLKWSDFVWSLEKLRNKPYNKTTRERDWFRVNPLEMILLGTQSLSCSEPVKKDHGTMMLVMASLKEEMVQRPRYWLRLLEVLTVTAQREDTPSQIVQRCNDALKTVWEVLEGTPEFSPNVFALAISQLKIIEVVERTQNESLLNPEMQEFVKELKLLVSSSSEGCSLPETESDSNVIECMMRHVYSSGREAACLEELTIQVYSIVKCSRGKTYPACFHQSQPSFERLVCAIRECSATSDRSLTLLLGIIQLLAVRCDQFDNQSPEYPPATPTLMKEGEEGVNEGEGGANEEGEGEGVKEGEGGGANEGEGGGVTKVVELFDGLTSAIAQWRELVPAQQTDHSDVVEKFLCLAHVILARNSLCDSLPETISFLRDPFHLLITYSTEGYLTDSPSEFLTELLEFVTALVEHGTPPLHALQTNLPNLFGPAFGVRHHLVSCKLLEYGYLAVCSQHRKSLLTEGLRFLTGVFHLFPPLDETRARERARNLRLEAMEVSGIILDNLIHSLSIEGAYRKGGRGESPGQVTTAPGQVMTPGSLTYPEVRDLHVPLTAGGELTVSQEEREDDRRSRILIFIGLLKLACAMIRNGENISFLFASCLPKLFTKSSRDETIPYNKDKLLKFFGEEPPPPSGGIPWNVDLKKLAIQILELGTLCLENNSTSPFQLCGIVVPKLIKNLEKMDSFSEEEKFSFMLDILHITQKRVEGGRGIDHFLSYGIDLLSLLTPFSASIDRMREFMDQMANHFVIYNQGSLLYLIKRACEFMMDTYKDETPEIQDLFRTLLFKGKRDEIRFVFKICNKQLAGEHYVPLKQYLYGYASGKLNRRQLVALCELIVASMDIEKPRKVIREVVSNVEEEEEVVVKEREAMEIAVVTKLISPCLKQVEDALELSRFKRDVWEDVSMQLSRIALFRTLFQSEFYTFSHYTNEEMLAVFQCKFPHDVLCDEDTMELLSISATRIEHVQTPRYDSLKLLLSGILRYFLTLQVETSDDENVQAVLIERQRLLQVYIDDFPRNREDKERLISSGYSSNLWNRRVSVLVKTNGTLSLEENMRQNLLACYSEFADILKQMAITHVSVDGEMIKVVNLFTDDLSFADLKGRRAIAVRMIDQRRMEGSLEGHFYERKAALLAKEDDIEAEFEKMSNVPIKPKTFTSSLRIGFLDCARCCGTRIIGCYAPTGEHCERPLEIGIRCDSAIASIYDEGGQEIENAELLLTEEGAFLFKAYTNGHPYDTSQVWLQLFTALLKEEEEEGEENEGLPSSLIPALVVPKGYPNQRTWEAMRRRQGTELTGSILTCRPDFSPEWRTYYDHRPERVRVGVDMVLHCGFTMNADQSHPVLQRQRSRFTKDLAGLIFEELMQELLADDWLSQFKFLGKVLSQYIGACITNGEGDKNLLVTGFEYERWKKMYTKSKEPLPIPPSLTSESGLPSKEALVSHLVNFMEQKILSWCHEIDMADLCISSHKQLLEMKCFLEKARGIFCQPDLLVKLKDMLSRCVVIVPLVSLPFALQEEIIHWIFRNEDRVWRYRGGRSHETLQQFMNFLGKTTLNTSSSSQGTARLSDGEDDYAGVAVFSLPQLMVVEGAQVDSSALQVGQMVGYAVGEVVQAEEEEEEEHDSHVTTRWVPHSYETCYEIVTTWIHPMYRGLSLSVKMYLLIIKQVPCQFMMCDLLEGNLERVIRSNWILIALERMKMREYIVRKRQQSYTVVTQTGATEQFEQVVISTKPLRVAMDLHSAALWVKSHLNLGAAVLPPILYSVMLNFRS